MISYQCRIFAIAVCAFANMTAANADEIVISGTGMALATVEMLGTNFSTKRPDISIVVLPSMGSGGGIMALHNKVIDLSVSARGLKQDEIESGLHEAFCFRTALVFATKTGGPRNINLTDLPELYRNPDSRWPDGAPLTVVMRAESGAEHPYLSSKVPGLADAFAVAWARHGAVVGLTDQLNLDIGEMMSGALVISTMLQINSEKRTLIPASIDGVTASSATLRDGSYPFSIRVCIIAPNDRLSPDGTAFLEYLKSEDAAQILNQLGTIPEN